MFESLRSLSDSRIITGSKIARAQEHSGLLAMIGFIAETERRQLYLRRGYSSLFSYCMQELGYSESGAMRRIVAARCIVKFPDVFDLLKADEINLGTISRVSKILTPENCSEVLKCIRKKSLREVEAIVAEHEPVPVFPRDRVRTIVARVPVGLPIALGEIHLRNGGKKSADVEESTLPEPDLEPTGHASHHEPAERDPQPNSSSSERNEEADGQHKESQAEAVERGDGEAETLLHQSSAKSDAAEADDVNEISRKTVMLAHKPSTRSSVEATPRPPATFVSPLMLERRARVEFTAHQELIEKLERIRAIASHRIPARASMEQLIDFMADYVIHREDPVKRHQRRQAQHVKKNTLDESSTDR